MNSPGIASASSTGSISSLTLFHTPPCLRQHACCFPGYASSLALTVLFVLVTDRLSSAATGGEDSLPFRVADNLARNLSVIEGVVQNNHTGLVEDTVRSSTIHLEDLPASDIVFVCHHAPARSHGLIRPLAETPQFVRFPRSKHSCPSRCRLEARSLVCHHELRCTPIHVFLLWKDAAFPIKRRF